MLLDFNLAQKRDECPSKAEAALGGTVAYMSPEHLRALAHPSSKSIRQVDHRSDIYSLGMVLFEMLTGHSPFEQSASYSVLPVMIEAMALERSKAAPSVRKRQPQVPWGMESIVRKCLAPDPAERYQRADQLAKDLRCLLEDRTLCYAPELSKAERLRKWIRRHPRLASSASVATVASILLLAAGAALAGVREHLVQARHQLELEEGLQRQRQYEAGTLRALCLLNTVADLQDHLAEGSRVCEETLALYGVLDHDNWQQNVRWRQLKAPDRLRLAEDTRELLSLLAWAKVRRGAANAAKDAVGLIDRADRIEGLQPSKAMWLDRARYLDQIGEFDEARAAKSKAEALNPVSARDHYMVATAYARKGNEASLQRAVAELNKAIALNPRHYWSWVQRGICYQELGEVTLAAADFAACIGLWPEFAWGHFNLGYALSQSGRQAEAVESYTAALKQNPEFLPAHVNRGWLLLELKQFANALHDFEHALERNADDAFLHTGRGVALEGLGRPSEADESFRKAFALIGAESSPVRARVLVLYGFAVLARLPDRARSAFEEVLQDQPFHTQALYGLALLAVAQNESPQAISLLDKAVDADVRFADARRQRALLYARQGDFSKATQDINWCLEREPRNAKILYTAACIAARGAENTFDPRLTNQALDLLEKAFRRGYGRDRAASDPDLTAVSKHPTFRQMVEERD
jgi:tetratricopeptide (TPR) repeat protein